MSIVTFKKINEARDILEKKSHQVSQVDVNQTIEDQTPVVTGGPVDGKPTIIDKIIKLI
jgi:hypothetical protein